MLPGNCIGVRVPPVILPVSKNPEPATSLLALSVTSVNALTRSQSKKIIAPPRCVSSPIAQWMGQSLIYPGGVAKAQYQDVSMANYTPKPSVVPSDRSAVTRFIMQRQSISRFVRDALQNAVNMQQEYTDKRGPKNANEIKTGDRELLSTDGIRSADGRCSPTESAPSMLFFRVARKRRNLYFMVPRVTGFSAPVLLISARCWGQE
ncbi:hypothetical protein PC128_g20787 [Phytophthora cactorum]|nr:hypothetical protein PC128_g20787 [Phytophthora cactorum]